MIIVWEIIIGRKGCWTFTDNHTIMTVNTEILTQNNYSRADIEKNWYGKRKLWLWRIIMLIITTSDKRKNIQQNKQNDIFIQ